MQSITGKISALLAGDRNLKETAQRAFNSYVKSVFLMKNKQMFDVKSIDMDKFAESLGLAAAPRVRFLERMEKKNNVKKFTEEEEPKVAEKKEVVKFNDDNDNSEDEMFSVKRVDHQIDAVLSSKEIDGNDSVSKKDDKVITKAQAAKKLLKKKIGNTKIVFDVEGDVVLDAAKQKQSKEGQEYEDDDEEQLGGGINIDQAKEILKAEDKFDKAAERARIREKHKEDKRKLKEEKARRKASEKKDGSDEEEEGSEPDLSWLPDPDKLYADKTEEEEENSDGSCSDDETETVEVKEGKRALTVIKSVIPAKKSRQESSSDEDDNDDTLDTGLSLGEDEDLAL